jgi:NTP pyrophosphatase (non-canonical NTP hydrolase)
MTKQVIDSQKYIDFVNQTTSKPSRDIDALFARLAELSDGGAKVERLLTAALGISAEAGELTEIVKKVFLQGKPYNEDNIIHLKKEAGDILWYMTQLCIALDTNFDELMAMNFEKLSARYPEGSFDVWRSENRKDGDI